MVPVPLEGAARGAVGELGDVHLQDLVEGVPGGGLGQGGQGRPHVLGLLAEAVHVAVVLRADDGRRAAEQRLERVVGGPHIDAAGHSGRIGEVLPVGHVEEDSGHPGDVAVLECQLAAEVFFGGVVPHGLGYMAKQLPHFSCDSGGQVLQAPGLLGGGRQRLREILLQGKRLIEEVSGFGAHDLGSSRVGDSYPTSMAHPGAGGDQVPISAGWSGLTPSRGRAGRV